MVVCNICKNEYKNFLSLSIHIRRSHGLTSKEYYDKYLKSINEGICLTCGKLTTFYRLGKGYLKFCSIQCMTSNDNVKTKREETNLNTYGVKNVFQSEQIKNKILQTNNERLGTDYPMQSAIVKEKSMETCKLKYGVEHVLQSPDIIKKARSKYLYNTIWFDSGWELIYYIWLMDHNIKFEYHPNISFKYVYNNKTHLYMPDFIVNNIIIDIKGNQFFDKDNNFIYPYKNILANKEYAKYQCMLDNNIKILRYDDIKPCIDYIHNKYGSNYINQFKTQA